MAGQPTFEEQPTARGDDESPSARLALGSANLVLLVLAIGALFLFLQSVSGDGPDGESIPVRATRMDVAVEQAPMVAARLMNEADNTGVSTDISNDPLWIRALIEPRADGAQTVVHVPSTGIGRADFLIRNRSGEILMQGAAGRFTQLINAHHANPGFSIDLPESVADGRLELLMRIEPVTLTRIHLMQWNGPAFQRHQASAIQRSVLVLGALLFLAIHAFTAALSGGRHEFTLLGAWLIARCAMLVMDSGLGASGIRNVEPLFGGAAIDQWLTVSLPFTTLLLARVMLARTIESSRGRILMTPLLYAFAILFGVSASLPVWAFQSAYWMLGTVLIFVLTGFSVSAWRKDIDRAGRWFALGALCDGIGAAFSLLQDTGLVSVTTSNWFANDHISLAAAVLAGLAVGQRLNIEREQRRRSQQDALALAEKYQAVYRSVPTALVSVTDGDRIVRYNEGFARLFNIEAHDNWPTMQVAALPGALLEREFPAALRARIRSELDEKTECDFEYALSRETELRWLRIMARGDAHAYEASLTDISEQKAVEHHLEMVAEHDPLTGALNRLGLSKHLQMLLETREPDEISQTAICYVDLDRFKMLNDLFGHGAGDSVLCEVVTRLQNSLGKHNLVARLGGDEFVIVLGASDQSVHEGLAWRALDAITDRAFQFDGKSFAVTASIGVFRLLPGLGQGDLIASADRACQDAKRRGRNQVVICEDSGALVKQREWELSLVARLNDPRTFEEFELVAQPIIGLHGSTRVGCELLLRHRGADDALLPAASLVAAAETNGEMAILDRWVVTRALSWLEANRERLQRLEFISINLSGTSLNDEFFKSFVLAQLTRYRHVARHIVLELTETVATQDIYMTCQFAHSVRKLGAAIALDDFGSGYSNFSSLATIPASYLKIDGRFVRSLREDGNGLNIVRTISLLAHELQMACIAEWVEDVDTLRMLRAVGVDLAQGHIVALPIRLDTLLDKLDVPSQMINPSVMNALARPIEPNLGSMTTLALKINGGGYADDAGDVQAHESETSDYLPT
ncbi:MAG: EAL domain-containing protein [Burkholderiaceae bacterium]